MIKKIVYGILFTAIVMAFTACSNGGSSQNDDGSAPVITDAFFVSHDNVLDFLGANINDLKAAYEVTSIGLDDNHLYLIFRVTDADKDFDQIEINRRSDFTGDAAWYWSNISQQYGGVETVCTFAACGFTWDAYATPEEKAAFVQSNQPIWVRATDKNGNRSAKFKIPGISFIADQDYSN